MFVENLPKLEAENGLRSLIQLLHSFYRHRGGGSGGASVRCEGNMAVHTGCLRRRSCGDDPCQPQVHKSSASGDTSARLQAFRIRLRGNRHHLNVLGTVASQFRRDPLGQLNGQSVLASDRGEGMQAGRYRNSIGVRCHRTENPSRLVCYVGSQVGAEVGNFKHSPPSGLRRCRNSRWCGKWGFLRDGLTSHVDVRNITVHH